MRKYEIMFIVRPDLEETEIKSISENFKKVLADNGATVTNEKVMGKRELAYEMNKFKSGFYFLFNIEANDDKAIKEFDRLALINEKIIRHLIVKNEK